MFEARTYRKTHTNAQIDNFEVSFLETDLWIGVDKGKYQLEMRILALEKIKEIRSLLVRYQTSHQQFITSMEPLPLDCTAHPIIQEMLQAGIKSNTGPMTSVAGIFAKYVGNALISEFNLKNIIIENGGDNYILNKNLNLTIPINAGRSEISEKIGIKLQSSELPIGICTSSGKFGHSYSFGNADTVSVVSKNIALADAMATRICNHIKTKNDLDEVINKYSNNYEIESLIIIMDGNVGIIGEHEITFL